MQLPANHLTKTIFSAEIAQAQFNRRFAAFDEDARRAMEALARESSRRGEAGSGCPEVNVARWERREVGRARARDVELDDRTVTVRRRLRRQEDRRRDAAETAE